MTLHSLIPALSDLHLHLRQGVLLENVAQFTDRSCAYPGAMPNLTPTVTTIERLIDYRVSLQKHFRRTTALMTYKLIRAKTPESARKFRSESAIAGTPYPEGATTN